MTRQNRSENRNVSLIREDLREILAKAEASAVVLKEVHMAKKLNTWTLGGLMVGPILGSGIILLPPLAYQLLGAQAIWAWVAILFLGGAFAWVFVQMTLKAHSDSGIAGLVAQQWGPAWGELASNYLTGAVVFGAVPVFLTAAHLWPHAWDLGFQPTVWAGVFLVVTVGLLLAGLSTVARLTLVLSTATAVLLVAAGTLGLIQAPVVLWPAFSPALPGLGPTLLLLFWAIVGWEVIGNYANEVGNPDRTIPRAGLISLAAVSIVYLITTLTLQTLAPLSTSAPTMALVLEPLFGSLAPLIAGLLGAGLCLGTVLMFMGAVTRMTAHRARSGTLPRWLGEKTEGTTPRRAILALGLTSVWLLLLVQFRAIGLEGLVSVANLFFLGNALLGLAAAWKILPTVLVRIVVVGLAVVLVLLASQGGPLGWLLAAGVTAASLVQALFRAPPAAS